MSHPDTVQRLPDRVLTLQLQSPGRRAELAERIDDLDLPTLQMIVWIWIALGEPREPRELWIESDRLKERVVPLLGGEVIELRDEVEIFNGAAFEKIMLEVVDVFFFLNTFIFGNHLEIDFDKIKRNIINGTIESGSIDRLLQMCGDLRDYPNANTVEEIQTLLSSIATSFEDYYPLAEVLKGKIKINTANYPIEVTRPYRDGVAIPREEWLRAFDHAVRCLKLIRRANMLTGKTKDTRLLKGDYEKYRQFVLDYQTPEQTFLSLAKQLAVDYNLDIKILLQIEQEPHRIGPGSGNQIYQEKQLDSGLLVAQSPYTGRTAPSS